MKVVLQRVTQASVAVGGKTISAIRRGVLLLVGVTHGDTAAQAEWLARKVATLRIFPDETGQSGFDKSLQDVGGQVLVISQFTLYGDVRKGRRPDFVQAAKPDVAEPLIAHFVNMLRSHRLDVQTGVFGAEMEVMLTNEGPVTVILDVPSSASG